MITPGAMNEDKGLPRRLAPLVEKVMQTGSNRHQLEIYCFPEG